ncbi:MAG: tetratricopeptide repeat protein [Candidatus Kuenenbacteria bacterium]
MLNKITKTFLYIAVFFLPIFFLPATIAPLALNKHIAMFALIFLALIFWLAGIIKSGKLTVKWSFLSSAIFTLLVILGISTVFSSAKTNSFWLAVPASSYLNFILYFVVFFLASNLLIKGKDILKMLWLLFLSSSIAALLFLIQLFFGPVFSWDFAAASGFNLFGSVWAFAIFLGGMTIALLAILDNKNVLNGKYHRYQGYLVLIIYLIALIIINYWIVWLAISLVSIIIIWRKMKDSAVEMGQYKLKSTTAENQSQVEPESDLEKKIDLKPIYLSAIVFILAVVMLIAKLPLVDYNQLPPQITLSRTATHNIVKSTFAESFKNKLIGAGPVAFGSQYVLYRPENVMKTNFWQVRFVQGKYMLATFLIEFGVLGIIGFLLIILTFLYQSFRLIILDKNKNSQQDSGFVAQLACFAAAFYFLFFWFFYLTDFNLLFMAFVFLGLWAASLPNIKGFGVSKEIIFTKYPQYAFFIMLLAIIITAGSLGGLYHLGRKYMGAVKYKQALAVLKAGELDNGINLINMAANLDSNSDLYLRELSEMYLIKLSNFQADQKEEADQDEIATDQEKETKTKQKQVELQQLIDQIELVSKKAIQINENNSQNWQQAGKVYQALAVLDANAYQVAVGNYSRASQFDPHNPNIFLNLGKIYFRLGMQAYDQIKNESPAQEQQDKLKEFAKNSFTNSVNSFTNAVNLKDDYTSAYYSRGIVHEVMGQYELALEDYYTTLRLEPSNEEVIQRIEITQDEIGE